MVDRTQVELRSWQTYGSSTATWRSSSDMSAPNSKLSLNTRNKRGPRRSLGNPPAGHHNGINPCWRWQWLSGSASNRSKQTENERELPSA
ncbi:hypothetical protein NC653_013838 [Populus alba x Populus x berolinensis]|uniref:Uncharacterized protein n=1 Tax=Populus alba x Populus x berolinensis TaxID=444605 RepID=A0AAD6QVM8_9ROSI|nr:hypothetical protein NC653_013838 [Populus alba x Populus x berolinensis]